MTMLSTSNRDAIMCVLSEYGYTLNQADCIEQLPQHGTHQSNLQVTEKKGRFHVRIGTPDGALLFSTPRAEGLGDFLKQYWYRNKVTQP